MARAGRRPGPTSTADEIVTVARALFAERGYQATTVRAVATAAGVNPALIHHFFGNKEGLFVAALQLPLNPAALIAEVAAAGPREELGARIVRTFVQVWRSPETGQPLQALLRGTATEEGAATLRRFVQDIMLPRAEAALGVSPLRLTGVLSQLIGFALASLVVRVEPLASATEDDVVALLGPSIQRYLDDPPGS